MNMFPPLTVSLLFMVGFGNIGDDGVSIGCNNGAGVGMMIVVCVIYKHPHHQAGISLRHSEICTTLKMVVHLYC